MSRKTLKEIPEDLAAFFKGEDRVLVAYLFGSYVRGDQTSRSAIDVAVLLSDAPRKMLDYYLHLVDGLSKILERDVDLVILNMAPPLLKYQVIKNGLVIYSRDEASRVRFEAKALSEYLDFSLMIARYDECLIKSLLA